MRLLAACLTVAAFVVPAPALATHQPASESLLQQTGSGGVWHSLPIRTEGADVSVEITIPAPKKDAATVIAVLQNGRLLNSTAFLRGPSRSEVIVSGDGGPLGRIEFERTTSTGNLGFGVKTTMHDAAAGDYGFVAWTAGDAPTWNLEVKGGPGVVVGEPTSGTGTYLHFARDFRGMGTLSAYESTVGAQANLATTLKVRADRTLLGQFGVSPIATGRHEMSMTTPNKTTRTCRCSLAGTDGPGDYVFNLTGGGAGLTPFADAFLVLADTVIPR